jgi:hypothetical protein
VNTFADVVETFIDAHRGNSALSRVSLRTFALWLDRHYAPSLLLPGGAQSGVSPSAATDETIAIAPTVPAADNGGDVLPFRCTKDQLDLLIWAGEEAAASIGGKDPADMAEYEMQLNQLRGVIAAIALTGKLHRSMSRTNLKAGLKALLDTYL